MDHLLLPRYHGDSTPSLESLMENFDHLKDKDQGVGVSRDEILLSMLTSTPFSAQIVYPELSNFSLKEITEVGRNLLDSHLVTEIQRDKMRIPAFSLEEDILLLKYIQFGQGHSFSSFFGDLLSVFLVCRSEESLERRVEYLMSLPSDKIDSLYSEFAESLCMESIGTAGFVAPKSKEIMHHSIEKEIDNLLTSVKQTDSLNLDNSILAYLRTENMSFSMKRSTIYMGRSTDQRLVDIDFNMISDIRSKFVSHEQVSLSLNKDLQFHLKNLGTAPVYVNSVPILRDTTCIVPYGALLDVAGVLFIFFPNMKVIEKIRADLQGATKKRPSAASQSHASKE